MTEETRLIEWNRIKTAITQCEDIKIMSQMNYSIEAIQKWASQSKQSLETQNEIAGYRLHINRKQGEWIEANIPEEGGNPTDQLSQNGKLVRSTLKEAGIDYHDSPKFRTLARMPEETFDQYISETKAKSEELTTKGILNYYTVKIVIPNTRRNRPTLPPGIFDVIMADPPWQYENTGVIAAAEKHYSTMNTEEIAHYVDENNTEIKAKFAENAAIFLWVTNPFVEDALALIATWGFQYKTNLVWVKEDLKKPGTGFYVRGRHELLFVCTRGSFVPDMVGKEPIGSVIFAPVREHSKKPDEAYEIAEKMYPGRRYLELFARNERDNWESWGDEIPKASKTQ